MRLWGWWRDAEPDRLEVLTVEPGPHGSRLFTCIWRGERQQFVTHGLACGWRRYPSAEWVSCMDAVYDPLRMMLLDEIEQEERRDKREEFERFERERVAARIAGMQ